MELLALQQTEVCPDHDLVSRGEFSRAGWPEHGQKPNWDTASETCGQYYNRRWITEIIHKGSDAQRRHKPEVMVEVWIWWILCQSISCLNDLCCATFARERIVENPLCISVVYFLLLIKKNMCKNIPSLDILWACLVYLLPKLFTVPYPSSHVASSPHLWGW